MLLHLLGLQFLQVLCLRAQPFNFHELQVQVHLFFTKVLNGNVKDVIVTDGSDCQAWDCRGRGFHIFKIARNFNFSFNYEIPKGFHLVIVLLFFLIIMKSPQGISYCYCSFCYSFSFSSSSSVTNEYFSFIFLELHSTYSTNDNSFRYVTKICALTGNFIPEFLICWA